MSYMQDWTPVILRSGKKVGASAPHHVTRSVAAQTALNIEKAPMDKSVQKKLSAESRSTLTAKRAAMKLTQVQLNQRCSFPPNTIRDLENGSLCPSNGQLNLLNRIIGGGLRLG